MIVTERRVVWQEWYETENTKTGWDSYGWEFRDDETTMDETEWTIVEHLELDKFYNPIFAIAEKETEI